MLLLYTFSRIIALFIEYCKKQLKKRGAKFITKCEVLQEIIEALYEWNFDTFGITDVYKMLGLVEVDLTQSDVFLINELIWDLVVERALTPGPINSLKGQIFLITSKEKLHERLVACKL